MIRKKSLPAQGEFWVARDSIRVSKGAPFYDQLGERLDEMGFGEKVRALCAPYYEEEEVGRPPIDPEVFFKMFFVGFFERIGSERGIASRCDDSLSIRSFLRYDLTEATPDHSTISKIRSRLPMEVFEEVFSSSLLPLHRAGLLKGERIGLDSSILEANASHDKLVRREDGMSYQDYIAKLAEEAGVDPSDKAAVHRFDRTRKDKRTSNAEWFSPNDPDAKFGPRKDGAWDMTHKVESAVDLDSGAILSIEVQPSDKSDATNMAEHFETAAQMAQYAEDQNDEEAPGKEEDGDDKPARKAVADKGYHKNEELLKLKEAGMEPVIAEPFGKAIPQDEAQAEAFEANRRNRKSDDGKQAMRDRAEKVERSFRHLLDYGGARRTTLCGHLKIAKRMLLSGMGFNLSILMWNLAGMGTLKEAIAGNRNPDWVDFVVLWIVEAFRRLVISIGAARNPFVVSFGQIGNFPKFFRREPNASNPVNVLLFGAIKSTVS